MKSISSAVTSALRALRTATGLNNQAQQAPSIQIISFNPLTDERCQTNNSGGSSQPSTSQPSTSQSNTGQHAAANAAPSTLASTAGESSTGINARASSSFVAGRADLPLAGNNSGTSQGVRSSPSLIMRLLSTYNHSAAKNQSAQDGTSATSPDKKDAPDPPVIPRAVAPKISPPVNAPADYAFLDSLHQDISRLDGETDTDPITSPSDTSSSNQTGNPDTTDNTGNAGNAVTTDDTNTIGQPYVTLGKNFKYELPESPYDVPKSNPKKAPINTSIEAENPYLLPDDKKAAPNQPIYAKVAAKSKNTQPIDVNQANAAAKTTKPASHIYESLEDMDRSSDDWDSLVGTFTDYNGEVWGAYKEDQRVTVQPDGKITIDLDGVIFEVNPLEEPAQANAASSLEPAEPEQKPEIAKEPPKAQDLQETEKAKKAKPLQFEKPAPDDSLIAALKQRRAAIANDSDSDSDDDD